MSLEGFLLWTAILLGSPIALILFFKWFDWWVHLSQPTEPLVYDGIRELREVLLEQYRED